MTRWGIIGLTAILFALYGLLILQPINLTAVDLGRHIKNGELLVQGDYSVLTQNLYSYTNPDFPFLNHHWGSGVIFYLIHQVAGFNGLSVLFLIVSLLTFWLFFDIAQKNSHPVIAVGTTIVLLPLLVSRTEIRPEIFSYLFLGGYFWILHQPRQKLLWLLIPLQLIWVNLHIYFFMGVGLVGLFWITEAYQKFILKKKNIFKNLSVVLISLIAVSLLNPFGLKGLLYPLTINQNYGYRVLENQNLWFLFQVIQNPMIIYFCIGFLALISGFIYQFRYLKKTTPKLWIYFLLAGGVSVFGFIMLRNITIFALFALPIISYNVNFLKKYLIPSPGVIFSVATFLTVIGLFLLVINPGIWQNRQIGIGIYPGIENSINFFKQNNLNGPIFNNYDIGSFLVYELYPQEKVFTDNRPEAYPTDFLQNTYVKAQEDDQKWRNLDAHYHFNTIFFYRLDLTPWAQQFLINRVKDPEWAPVYVDDVTIILVRRDNQNKAVIKQFEIPKERFGTDGR